MTLDYAKDVVPVVLRLAALNRPMAEAMLRMFGAETARKLKPEEYEPFIAEAEKAIGILQFKASEKEPLTTRDHFALAALQSPLLAHWTFDPPPSGGVPAEEIAERAYLIADAMIQRRIR